MKKKNIFIIETGGTISVKTNNPLSEYYGKPDVHILEFIDELGIENVNINYKAIAHKISHELTINEIQELAELITKILRSDTDGIVVSIGTNAIEDIAYYVGLLVDTDKPIVFTGSHYPQGSLFFDGKLNIYNSIILASSDDAKGIGVLLNFNGTVVSARDACKITPGLMDSFDLLQMGRVGEIIGGRYKPRALPLYRHTYKSEFHIKKNIEHAKVCVIYAHLVMDASIIETAINSGVKGIISAGFGKGYQNKQITELLHKATIQGITVVRCPRISACYINSDNNYDTKYGFLTSNGLSPQKSSILLSTALAHTEEKDDLIRIFEEY
ncbi:MAG: asparaginase [Tatlockia sp.]|nr:asparaginase [Tatlockia sp.]